MLLTEPSTRDLGSSREVKDPWICMSVCEHVCAWMYVCMHMCMERDVSLI